MPITRVTYKLISDLGKSGFIPSAPAILELGESNWYGDVTIGELEHDISRLVKDQHRREALLQACLECREKLSRDVPDRSALWDLPKIFFRTMLDMSSYTAIDLSGSDASLKLDLNQPVGLGCQHDLVLDLGTAEHVFNVYQLFKSVHDLTRPGGVMVHVLPFQGWVDHGFYNFHPTFYIDLAAANSYKMTSMVYWQDQAGRGMQLTSREQIATLAGQGQFSGNGTLLVTCIKSEQESGFQTPMQGYYTNTISEEAHAAWHHNR